MIFRFYSQVTRQPIFQNMWQAESGCPHLARLDWFPILLQLDETPLFAPQVSLEKSLIVSVTLVFCLRALPFFSPHPIIAYQTCLSSTTNHCLHFNCILLLFVAFPLLTTTARGIASGSHCVIKHFPIFGRT